VSNREGVSLYVCVEKGIIAERQFHNVFPRAVDNGEGVGTIAGGSGMVWATALQIGELVDSAQKVRVFAFIFSLKPPGKDLNDSSSSHQVHDPTEIRILVTHSSVGREGLLAQLAMMLKADFTISGSLHCESDTCSGVRYPTVY
jgi:hypothetical protein